MAVATLTKMKNEMEPFWDGLPPQDTEKKMEGTFDDYLSALGRKEAWMGAMEVGALAKATGHPMEIYRIGAPPCVYGRGNKKQPIRLWYHKKHYELIISEPPDQDPDSLLRGSVSGLKGG